MDLPVSDAVRRGLAEGVPLTLGTRPGHRAGAPAAAELARRGADAALPFAVQRGERALHPAQRQQRSAAVAWAPSMPRSSSCPKCAACRCSTRPLISADRRYEASVRAKIDYGAVPFTLARADVLGQRLASRKRLVHMDAAAVIRKYGSTVLGAHRRGAVAGRAVSAGVGRAELGQVRPLAAVDPADQHLGAADAARAARRQALPAWCATTAGTSRARA